MGLVAQKSILFNDTISNNIRLNNKNASNEDIIEAAKIANAHDFILEQPEGVSLTRKYFIIGFLLSPTRC